MISPPHLKSGDKIGLVATARKVSEVEMRTAIQLLQSWGLEVVCGNNLYESDRQFAGTDEQRIADFQWMLDRKDIRAILCARGGYGSIRIIDRLNFSAFMASPKWIIGYSDITVFHAHLHQVLGVRTIHGAMPLDFPKEGGAHINTLSLKKALFGEAMQYSLGTHSYNRTGTARGELVGGNLSILCSLSGSVSFPKGKGKVLFLEDLDEYLYHIDRMMMNLKRSGLLSEISGLVVGGMSKMNDNSIPFGRTAEEIIKDAVKEWAYPVCFGFPAGHLEENNALVFGKEVQLVVEENGALLNS
jgi:muramoyltetrapeptide carboxypeptidase